MKVISNAFDDWAAIIKDWQSNRLEQCYFFVHASMEGFSPSVTKYVSGTFNAVCNAQLPEVKLLTMF